MKPDALWKVVAAALTVGAVVVGITRHLDALEARLQRLELRETYLHGQFAVPKE